MPGRERRGDNQKLKLMYLAEIFSRETDEQHPMTMSELTAALASCGVNADRKTLYQDLEELRRFGMDIITDKNGRSYYYYLGSRDFQLPELKLLVDSVQSAKFISERKSRELIKKLENLVSRHEGVRLNRQVMIAGRVKTMNESIYYTVDKIHEAIGAGRVIRFKYYRWNEKKEMVLRRDGAWYEVSPWALMWDDENYYLVAFDASEGEGCIKHYRVDKMLRISITDRKREGLSQFRKFDMGRYSRSHFGMFGGEETRVTLEAENEMAGVLIDRFGKDIPLLPVDEDHFRTMVDVAVSSQFLGWIIALGSGIRITAPDSLVERMKEEIRRLSAQYGDQ